MAEAEMGFFGGGQAAPSPPLSALPQFFAERTVKTYNHPTIDPCFAQHPD